MTQRLPIPGQDDGTWGDVLNGYLQVEHNSDGTLKIRTDGTIAPLASGKVPTTNLGSGTASSSNYLRGDGTWAVPNGTSASNATTSAPGLVQLAGDLGGTSTSATAPTLAPTTNVTGIITSIINSNSTVTGATQKSSNLSDLTSVSTAKTNLGLSTVATSGSYSDLISKPTIPTAGTTSETYAAGNDTRITGSLQSSNNLSDLASASTARTNLGLGTASTISSTAGGDLSGTLPAPTVAKINGISLPSSSPSNGNVLTALTSTTTAWQTPAAGVTLDSTSPDIQPLGVQAAGSVGKAADAGHVHAMPRLDQVNVPTAAVSLNSQKITGLANGTASSDAATFGQIPVAGTTSGTYAVGNDTRVIGAIQSSTATTKGDILAASAASTITRVGVGSNNQVLTADSTQTAGVKWATPTTTDATKLAIASNLSDLASVSTARTNLGLGTAATQNGTAFDAFFGIAASTTTAGSLALNVLTPVDATAGTVAMTLPTGQTVGTRIGVRKQDSTTNTVTITGNIAGVSSTTHTLSLNAETVVYEADSSGSWWVVGGNKSLSSLDSRYPLNTATPGGDLTGTYAALTVAKLQGTVALSGTASPNQALVATSSTAASWATIPTNAANTYTGNQTAPAIIASGLTGATAASRYVGATATGAPTSGTFVIGDFVIDQTGALWICTTAGTPGTWTKASASNATSSAPGLIKLAGDVSGSATVPLITTSNGVAIATTSGAQTLTNKTITKRIATLIDAATVTPDSLNYDGGLLASLSQSTTIANPTGTPVEFQQYLLRIKSASAQTLTFGAQYRGGADMALPTITSGNAKTDYYGFQWNGISSTWDMIAMARTY